MQPEPAAVRSAGSSAVASAPYWRWQRHHGAGRRGCGPLTAPPGATTVPAWTRHTPRRSRPWPPRRRWRPWPTPCRRSSRPGGASLGRSGSRGSTCCSAGPGSAGWRCSCTWSAAGRGARARRGGGPRPADRARCRTRAPGEGTSPPPHGLARRALDRDRGGAAGRVRFPYSGTMRGRFLPNPRQPNSSGRSGSAERPTRRPAATSPRPGPCRSCDGAGPASGGSSQGERGNRGQLLDQQSHGGVFSSLI